MDTHPPNFLIEFGRITRAIFFNSGGQPPPAPLPAPLARSSKNSLLPTSFDTALEEEFISYFIFNLFLHEKPFSLIK